MTNLYCSDFRAKKLARDARTRIITLAIILIVSLAIGGRIDYLMLFSN